MADSTDSTDSTGDIKSLMDLVPDSRPQEGAWAPGNYVGNCSSCGKYFVGDNRAYHCADCAYELVESVKVKCTCKFLPSGGMDPVALCPIHGWVEEEIIEEKCCGWKRVKCPDDLISGHIEYETLSLCGEDIDCYDECYKSWSFCPYCGRDFSQDK